MSTKTIILLKNFNDLIKLFMTFLDIPLTSEEFQLESHLDASVNFVTPINAPMEALEARFVRRSDDYIIAYISPQTACSQACRFCHLTASGQVKGRDASLDEILFQAEQVLTYFGVELKAKRQRPARVVHFNFMARGEALASEVILNQGQGVMEGLFKLAKEYKLTPSVKISTIGTDRVDDLLSIFPYEQPDFYYSLYSMESAFRKYWLPNAPDPLEFLQKLKNWQDVTHKIPTLHQAIIAGENSSLATVSGIIEAVDSVGLATNVNIVRYNPPSVSKHGVEASELQLAMHVNTYQSAWPNCRAKILTKVGFDVAASCGMFVGGRQPKESKHLLAAAEEERV